MYQIITETYINGIREIDSIYTKPTNAAAMRRRTQEGVAALLLLKTEEV